MHRGAHADGDAILWMPGRNRVHTGDVVDAARVASYRRMLVAARERARAGSGTGGAWVLQTWYGMNGVKP